MENKNTGKKVFSVLGIIVGVAAVIFGIVVFALDADWISLDYASFGGDFYTYTYKGIRAVADNIIGLGTIVRLGIGFILLIFGFSDICFFGMSLSSNNPHIYDHTLCNSKKTTEENNEVAE